MKKKCFSVKIFDFVVLYSTQDVSRSICYTLSSHFEHLNNEKVRVNICTKIIYIIILQSSKKLNNVSLDRFKMAIISNLDVKYLENH